MYATGIVISTDGYCHCDGFFISTEGRNRVPQEHRYFVYLLTNWNNKAMYVGVTNNLEWRIYEHKNKTVQGVSTEKYNVSKLVYFEETNDVASAISREKEIKKWRREKKDALAMTVRSRAKITCTKVRWLSRQSG